MTEKRFKEIVSVEKVIDTQTGKEYKCIIDDDLLKLLNELHEEIQALKLELELSKPLFSRRELETKLKEQHEENEQLKQDVTDTNMANSILQERVEHYRKENEQLKKENNELKEKNEFLQKRIDCIIQSLQNDLNTYGMMGRFG